MGQMLKKLLGKVSSIPTIIKPQYSLDVEKFSDQYEKNQVKRDANRVRQRIFKS